MIDIFKFLKKSVRIELIYTSENGEKCSFDSEVIEIEEDKIFIKHLDIFPAPLNVSVTTGNF